MEEACFSSTEPREIWRRVAQLVERSVGIEAVGACHYSVSIGAVVGIDLADGRRVAVKVFAPWHDPSFLIAAHEVRRDLVRAGYPGPRPLTALQPFGASHVWIEEWLEAPPAMPPAEVVDPLALHLADFVKRCAKRGPDPALAKSWQTFERPVGIWRNPPRPEVDLEIEVPDGDWIREIAEYGRSIAESAPGPKLIGHVDWRPDNVRVDADGRLIAVYDWDSVQLTGRVHVLAGACTGLRPEGMARFLAAYEAAAGTPLLPAERRAVAGRVIWSQAIWAQYELVRQLPPAELRFVPRLKAAVDAYLQAAADPL